jgi:hypothetical protein
MARLALKAAPTFKAKVGIPVAGSAPVEVEFTFKHRTKTELDEFVKSRADKTDAESFMAMVEAWELTDAFTAENVEQLLESYIGAAMATFQTYLDELVQAKRKN